MLLHTALVALGATLAAAVQPLEVQGAFFVNPKTGNRFQIIGAAYQPGGSAGYDPTSKKDPLSHKEYCLRDAALMQALGINTIRVYNLDPNLNHDECASIFNAAGMYMLLDVNSPLVGESLDSTKPWESYYAAYLNRTFAVVEAFKSYPNTLGFFSGNEVIDKIANGATAPPYVRAVTRDIKQYIKNHSNRTIPVGYSAADVRSVLFDSYRYFQCTEDGEADNMSHADMFALNSYSWCGDSSFSTSKYDELVAGFTGTSVPIFFSEFGCNVPAPRVFTEISTIYGSQMNGVFSGGIVYEYAQEPNDYGLVNIADDGSAQIMADYNTLQAQYAKLDIAAIQGTKPPSTAANAAPKCDSSLITTKGFNNNFTLPVLPPGAAEIIRDGVKPTPSGKIVTISSWNVTLPVKDVSGKLISGLAVKPLADDENNTPGTSTGGTSSNTTTTTSKNAAPMATAFMAAPAAMALAALAIL